MPFYLRALTMAAIPILVTLVLFAALREGDKTLQQQTDTDFITVRNPKIFLWIGIICGLGCLIVILIMSFFPNGTETLFAFIIFGLLLLMGLYIVLASCNWKIIFSQREPYFIYRTFLGRSYQIFYADCISYKYIAETIILKTTSKTCYIDMYAVNAEYFSPQLRKYKIKCAKYPK